MADKTCPICKLINPQTSRTCDCGYNFHDYKSNVQTNSYKPVLESKTYGAVSKSTPIDLEGVTQVLTMITAIAGGIFSLWCTVIAFIGGTLPVLGWKMEGGLISGLFWLFIVDPIVITVCYWISLLLLMPIGYLLTRD